MFAATLTQMNVTGGLLLRVMGWSILASAALVPTGGLHKNLCTPHLHPLFFFRTLSMEPPHPVRILFSMGSAYANVLPLPVGAQMHMSCDVLWPPASPLQTAACTGKSSTKPS